MVDRGLKQAFVGALLVVFGILASEFDYVYENYKSFLSTLFVFSIPLIVLSLCVSINALKKEVDELKKSK